MKIGDYARTECGIAKIKGFETKNKEVIELDKDIMICNMDCYRNCCTINQVIKSSPNIVELLEPIDLMYIDIDNGYAGGIVVPRIAETQNELNEYMEKIKNGTYILKGVVTHEQLENNVYKVEL